MSQNRSFLIRSIFSLAFIVLVACSEAAFAQSALTGEWKASIERENPDKIYLSFERPGGKAGKNQMGQTFDFADLQGLSREEAVRGGAVKFSLVREAGRIDCEGSFQNGKGSGTFRFTGNQTFVSAMKSRGFDFEKDSSASNDGRDSENRLFVATALNITTALADDLVSAGFGRLDVEDLIKAAIFKIDADFVSQAVRMGFDKEPFESLVKMRIFKITPEFVSEARNEGLTNLSVEDLVKMRIFNIDSDFIRQAKSEGIPMDIDKLVEKRIGVRRPQ